MNDPTPTHGSPLAPGLPAPLPPPVPDHELIRRIGRGAYGEVWLARSVTGAFRAVKIVRRSSFDHERPFEREFEGIQKFEPISRTHESQVDILHVGRGEDYFYYVMELADDQATGGQIHPDNYHPRTLKSDLLFRHQLSFEECLSVGIALTTALEHLHRSGLVHRDVKPSNIIFVNGVAKLADIGLVTGVDTTRSYVGTEGFAAPEGPGTAAGDLFSLGKVLYEMATGKDRQEFPELPTNLREMPEREGLVELNAVIAQACRHDPRDRYPNAAAMRADLELLQSGKSLARLRRVERRLHLATRTAVIGSLLALLAIGAWLYEARQTRIVNKLAREVAKVSDENRGRLTRQRIANGSRHMNEGDLSRALLWFTEALPLVDSDPKQSQIHRLRLGAVLDQTPRLLNVFSHEEQVRFCEFSADGKSLLTFSLTNARIWDIATGQLLSPVLSDGNLIRYGGLSSQGGRVLTSGGDGRLRVWDQVDNWRGSVLRSNVTFSMWHPNGSLLLSCSSNEPVELINGQSGIVERKFAHEGTVTFAAISSDGRRVALAENQQVTLWDGLTGQRLGSPLTLRQPLLTGIIKRRTPLQFDQGGRRLLVMTGTYPDQRNYRVEVWDTITHRTLFGPNKGQSGFIGGSALSSDGSRVILVNEHDWDAGKTGAIELWDVSSGSLIRTISSRISGSGALFLPQNGAVAAASWDGFAQIWNSETGVRLTPPLWHRDWLFHMAISPDGTLFATAGDDAVVKLWQLTSRQSERQVVIPLHDGHPAAILSAAFDPDDRFLITGSCDGVLRVWDTTTRELVRELHAPAASSLVQVEWSSDGSRVLAVEGDFKNHLKSLERIGLWDAHSGESLPFAQGATGGVVTARFSPNGALVASGHRDGTVRLFRSRTGETILPPLGHSEAVRCLAWSPDGHRLIVGLVNGTVCGWESQGGRRLFETEAHNFQFVRSIAFSPDGKRFVTVGGDQHGRIWDLASGTPTGAAFKHDGTLFLAAWHPEGKRIITGGLSRDIRSWDAKGGENVLPPMSHEIGLTTLSFSPDGKLVVSGSSDHTARVWDASTGEALIVPVNHGFPVTVARILDRGRQLFSAGEDGTGRFLNLSPTLLPTEDLRAYARAVNSRDIDDFEVPRKLTKEEVVWSLQGVRARHPEFFHPPKP